MFLKTFIQKKYKQGKCFRPCLFCKDWKICRTEFGIISKWEKGYNQGYDEGYTDGVRKAMIVAQRNTLNNRKEDTTK